MLSEKGISGIQRKNIEEASGYMNQPVSLVILDINLPDGDGRMFLKHIRQSNTVPVLLLTARNTEADMLQGFDAGCDDYVTKPFSMAVLLRRIEVLLKRAENTDSRFYYSGALAYDFDGKQLRKDGQEVKLTATESVFWKPFWLTGIRCSQENSCWLWCGIPMRIMWMKNTECKRAETKGKNRGQSSGTGSHQDSFWHWIQME